MSERREFLEAAPATAFDLASSVSRTKAISLITSVEGENI